MVHKAVNSECYRHLAAIYARVSTHEQTTENQITELEALAAQRGLTIIRSYEDKGYSGKTDNLKVGLYY